ncbi:MAG: PTS sugar transporter subunit IIA [Pirellulales bacterium]
MPESDFDVAGLANHLHLSPAQILRLAERGQVPGRRVGGEWRFHPTEIHHWWEQRIGLADEQQLAEMELALRGPRGQSALEQFSLVDFLPVEGIELQMQARTRNAVFPALIELASRTEIVWDTSRLEDALRAHEDLHSTAMDNGAAILHPRRPLPGILADALILIGRTSNGIPFGNPRGVMTDVFFVLCMLDDRSHLRMLARLSRLLTDTNFLDDVRSAVSPIALRETLAVTERRVLGTTGDD